MKFILSACLTLLLFVQNTCAQTNARKYLEDAIKIMQQHAVNKGSINWDALSKAAFEQLGKKEDVKDAYPVILKCLEQLQDNHSKFFKPEVVAFYLRSYHENGVPFPYPKDSLINHQLAYISVPAIGSFNEADWKTYVHHFYQKILKLDANHPKAWIIDVRGNEGGMFSPMFTAIQPFLDQKNVIGSKDNAGKTGYYSVRKGTVFFDRTPITRINVPAVTLTNKGLPIFVLTNRQTASSGEFVTASFAGQKNVYIIGENTQGLTSDNSEFKLSDGAFLVLTTGNIVDRDKKEYSEVGKGIPPNILLKSDQLSDYIRLIETKL